MCFLELPLRGRLAIRKGVVDSNIRSLPVPFSFVQVWAAIGQYTFATELQLSGVNDEAALDEVRLYALVTELTCFRNQRKFEGRSLPTLPPIGVHS